MIVPAHFDSTCTLAWHGRCGMFGKIAVSVEVRGVPLVMCM